MVECPPSAATFHSLFASFPIHGNTFMPNRISTVTRIRRTDKERSDREPDCTRFVLSSGYVLMCSAERENPRRSRSSARTLMIPLGRLQHPAPVPELLDPVLVGAHP